MNVEVPDFRFKNYNEALRLCHELGLVLDTGGYEPSGENDEAVIVSFTPAMRTLVPVNTVIKVEFYIRTDNIKVPKLIDEHIDNAYILMDMYDYLRFKVTNEYGDYVEKVLFSGRIRVPTHWFRPLRR